MQVVYQVRGQKLADHGRPTLHTDRSPRISGIEIAFEDGEVIFGSMSRGGRPRPGAVQHERRQYLSMPG
nr:hypothetical protein [Frankia sp. Mgl5]